MFTMLCVPNMYLFGTFSMQNATEIALTEIALLSRLSGAHQPGWTGSGTARGFRR